MTVELILVGIVGVVLGVLAALYIDTRSLVRRVQEANSEKQKAQAVLQKFQIQHQAALGKLQATEQEMKTAVAERTELEETIANQLAEIEASREQLQTSIHTNEALKENIQDTQARLEELEALQFMAEEKLAIADAENQRLTGEGQLMEAEIALLEQKSERLTREHEQVQQQAEEHQQKWTAAEARFAAVDAEKDTALVQLQQAELANAEQMVKIEALQERLSEIEKLRQELSVTNEKLQTSDAHLSKLQDTMDDVKTKMHYSGKNQLQLIRGIGPTYARRLNEFGIQTFAELAECNAEQVASIIKKKNWQSVDIQKWLEEAKALAATLED